MPAIPRSTIDAYTEQLKAISEQNQATLEAALGRIDWDADVATVREQLIAIMDEWCGNASEQSAMVASVFYDGCREIAVGKPLGAFAESGREPRATAGAVRAFVQELVDGKGSEPVKRKCLDRLDYEVKRSAAECVDANAKRDKGRPRYARVPSGMETCDFCIMLASRGPVYHTEKSAGAFDHFHANCDCRVVPMWGTYEIGPSRRASATEVEGYDPDALYEQYVQMMTNPEFRDRMARAADRARGGDGNVKGRDTSHPMVWAEAKRKGLVKFGSVGEIQDYIRGAKSYEDLMERITLVGGEWDQYALSDSYAEVVRKTMRDTRDRILGYEGNYPRPKNLGAGRSYSDLPPIVKVDNMSFDPTDADEVDRMRRKLIDEIRFKTVENAYVMTANGEVWHSEGDEYGVNIDDAPLDGSIVMHNHIPRGENDPAWTFGGDDFEKLQEFPRMLEMWCVAEGFDDVITATESVGDIQYDYARKRTLVSNDAGDIHKLVMEWLDDQGHIHYRRDQVPSDSGAVEAD